MEMKFAPMKHKKFSWLARLLSALQKRLRFMYLFKLQNSLFCKQLKPANIYNPFAIVL